MSRKAYFTQYTSPNIYIVPTESFIEQNNIIYAPPRVEETTTHSNVSYCEWSTDGADIGRRNSVNFNNLKQIVVEPDIEECIVSAGASPHLESEMPKKQDIDTMESATNASQGIKESSSLFKSRNNLVDLTGFNMLKRDSISSTKTKNDLSIKDTTKRKKITENYAERKTNKSKVPTKTYFSGKSKINNTQNNESTPSPTGIKNKQLGKHNMENKVIKVKEKSKNKNPEKDPKCNRPKESAKDLSLSQNKAKPNKNSLDTKSLESKTKDLKKTTEFKNKVKPKYASRPKSETKPSISAKKTPTHPPSHNDGDHLDSEAIKRYYIQRHNDSKPKSENKAEQKSIKLNKIAAVAKTNYDRKQIVKPEVNSSNEKKAIKTKEISHSVRYNNTTQLNKNTNEKQDAIPKPNRKRARSDLNTDKDDNVITLEQGATINLKTKTNYVPPVKKSKPNKCRKIKLIINIECRSSVDSDSSESDNEQNQQSPQDLTFLDDFNVDEIVESLNSCGDTVECKKISSPITEDTKPNNKISKTQVLKGELANDFNLKLRPAIKAEEVIIIHSDSDNDESESGKRFDATRNDCVKPMEIGSTQPAKSSVTNNVILKQSNKCSSDFQATKLNICLKTDEILTKSNQIMTYKIPLQNITEKLHKPSNSVNNINENNVMISEKSSKFSNNNKNNTSPKTIFNSNAQNTSVKQNNDSLNNSDEVIKITNICSPNKKDEIETSLESMFDYVEPKLEMNVDHDPTNALNTCIKSKPEINLSHSDDTIEKSLTTMFKTTVKEEVTPLPNLEDNSVESYETLSDINQCVETRIDSVPVIITNKEPIKTTFSSIEDRDAIPSGVKQTVMNEYLVKDKEKTTSLHNSENQVTESNKILIDVNQNVECNIVSASVNTSSKTINSVDTLQESVVNNLPRGMEIDMDNFNVKEKEDNAAKNTDTTNTKITPGTKIDNNLFKKSKTEGDNDKNVVEINSADNHARGSINTKNKSNIDTVDKKQSMKDTNELIVSNAIICTENEVKIETTVGEIKTNHKITKTSDANEQDKNKAPKTNETLTEACLKIDVTPNLENPKTKIVPSKAASKLKIGLRKKYCMSKKYGKDKFDEKFNNDEGLMKSIVSMNNTTNLKANNKNDDTKPNDAFKDASLHNSELGSETYSDIMTSNQFMENVETRMSEHLNAQFRLTSIIRVGFFSIIYKCKDELGFSYAVKVLKDHDIRKGNVLAKMLKKIQNYTTIQNSSVLFMINSFRVGDNWCYLTEYYTRNLKQALLEKKGTFHINLVQKLSSQLVAAVFTLTNNNIIHTDIKPEHVLLDNSNSRLKLCGFDKLVFRDKAVLLPNTGTAGYRAPEIILGYSADFSIDVWATALVMFEMATSLKLFNGYFNNEVLYQQICTFGSFEPDMINESKFRFKYFSGTSFIRRTGRNGQKSILVHAMHRNKNLERELYTAYRVNWERRRSKWQVTEDLDKLERFHALLQQMLALDPRCRLPIQFIGASEFFHDLLYKD